MKEVNATPWEEGCRALRQIKQTRLVSVDQVRGHPPRAFPWRLMGRTDPHSLHLLRKQFDAVTAQMVEDLSARGVLCDATEQCTVFHNISQFGKHIHACVSNATATARICEPYGERWQQTGAARFHFLRGMTGRFVGREPSIAALQRSSGGNALLAALALCDRVRLYGAGLYSTSPTGDKRYLHYYDEGVGHCNAEERGSQAAAGRYSRMYRWKTRNIVRIWRADRLRHELFLHLLSAVGMVEWRQ